MPLLISLSEKEPRSIGITYQFEREVTYGGANIGQCGAFKTRAELEAACTSNPDCVGYSTINDHNMGAVAENGYYPWCLKRSEDNMRKVKRTHYYRKVSQESGKLLFFPNVKYFI